MWAQASAPPDPTAMPDRTRRLWLEARRRPRPSLACLAYSTPFVGAPVRLGRARVLPGIAARPEPIPPSSGPVRPWRLEFPVAKPLRLALCVNVRKLATGEVEIRSEILRHTSGALAPSLLCVCVCV